MDNPATINLRHGYSYTDLDRIAHMVIAIDRWHTADDERHDAVLCAITEHLLTAAAAPTRRDLINIGLRASNRHTDAEIHHHGWDKRRYTAGSAALPGYQRYWQDRAHLPWDERLIERLALAQIWPYLTPAQQQAVMALALTGDHAAAAATLGVPLPTYSSRLRKARAAAAALWHEHETPPTPRRDKRVLSRSGHYRGRRLLTDHDLDALRQRRADGATLRQLAAETGYSAGALCNLLRGKRRPHRPA